MHVMVGGGDGRADRNVMRFLFPLAAVLLLSVGVSAVPEELKPVQEQPPQEKASSPHPVGPVVSEDDPNKGNLGFIHAFVASISVIIVSELGDKTFFIAAIMAMRYNRLTVLAGAMLALGLMTCLSVLFGYATTIIPRIYTYYVSTALFAIFGVRMLREGLRMSPDEGQEELEEVQAEIKKKDEELQRSKLANGTPDIEAASGTSVPQGKWHSVISPIFIQALTLTFLAEWGDRSQLTTIILAAREDPFGVAVGGTLGHCLCTGLAVIGGRMIAQKISVRTVTIIGGIVFLAFAFSALFIKPEAGF
ncbi:putative divalent cation/proton antiporter TMEM165 [Pempheris klunzingeri]|uniref:putative divalent cation/proton antiporter TMEM165 n=1 Tax=Pempheris klunzingeri TaxID=3127111 RepID=UPI0039810403